MHILKKLIFAAAFLSLMFVGASAEENLIRPIGGIKFTAEKLDIAVEPKENVSLFSTPEQSLEDYLIEQCMNHEEEIWVDEYNLSKDEFGEIYFSFATRHPELLVRTSYKYGCYPNTTHVALIYPYYIFENTTDDNEARILMEEKVNEYVTLAEAYETPLEKLLAVHDKMVETYEYDKLINSTTPTHGENSFHAYGLFKNNTAVCQGYAQAFYMIANKLGVKTNYCRSDSITHIWNYVKLDGKWYHVDVTWDDPVSKTGTIKAYHDDFLVSDSTRRSNILSNYPNADTNDWIAYLDVIPNCGSITYESEYLFNLPFPFNISQEDGCFVASCKKDGKQYDFRSQSLHSGIIVTTKPVRSEDKDKCNFTYWLLTDYSGNITLVSVNYKNEKYSSLKKQVSLGLERKTLYSVEISCDASADYTDIFIWDLKNLRPACDKMRAS